MWLILAVQSQTDKFSTEESKKSEVNRTETTSDFTEIPII